MKNNCIQIRNLIKQFFSRSTNVKTIILAVSLLPGLAIPWQGISQTKPEPGTIERISWKRQFDVNDRCTLLIDPAGRETRYTYIKEPSGKSLVTKTNEEGSIKLFYDNRDLLITMNDGLGKVNYQYDAFSRLTRVQREGEPAVEYQYDPEGRMVVLKVGDFYSLSYTYDFLGRLSKISTPAGPITYEYQTGLGQVIRVLPNKVETIWEFDARGQQTVTTHLDPDRYVLAKFKYYYRPDGLIDAVVEKTQKGEKSTKFDYDNVGRLVRAYDNAGEDFRYDYDQVGNRVQAASGTIKQVCDYDWAGRLTALNGKASGYDEAGNLSSVEYGDNKMNYQYNLDCQLVNVNNLISYKYDGDGKIAERQANGSITKFISDPLADYWQPLVMDNKTSGKTLFIWDKNAPLISIRNGNPEYILTDHLGSARLIVDAQGTVKQQFDYEPFGLAKDGMDQPGINPGFSGLFYDTQAKLYLTRVRAYDPNSGQFLQIEPLKQIPSGSQKELSMYAYCGNDPVNFVDKNGTWPRWVWGPENMAWQVWHTDFLDRNYAKEYYATKELSAKSTAMAWAWGTIGGYIPGEEKSIRQKYISDIWDFVPVVSTVRTWGSSILNSKEGKPWDSFIDILSLGVDYLGDADNIYRYGIKNNLDKLINNKTLKETNITFARGSRYLDDLSSIKTFNEASNTLLDYQKDLLKDFEYPTPSNVGGVSLTGAAQALNGIGQIEGLSLDANNNLILIGKKGDSINMPPMRVDDIVTVFRSVYVFGEGPSVTIDPNPDDPENSAMIIKHGEATEGTYVGWILYQADRLMKCYMLGVDNVTSRDVVSKVPGYEDVLSTIYFGDGIANAAKHEGKWERFWIVPSKVDQFSTKNNEVTIFDVPLKVRTQLMKWENGALVDDSLGKSSTGATSFSEWFTREYDAISNEQFLTPPPEFGMNEPVAVFSELRRIATITALAEKMRDQGVPIPFWMRNHQVSQVKFEKYTPGMQVNRTRGSVRAQIFGGVTLSPEKKVVRQFTSVNDLKQLPEAERISGDAKLKTVNELSASVVTLNTESKPLETNTFEIENETYRTIQLPGSETKALSPCRLEESDLIVTVPGGKEIRLPRLFNSFFNPNDGWGPAWTMDLPRLEKMKIPVDRTANHTSYQTVWELVTPLNSLFVRFADVKEVPELKSRIQVPDQNCNFFGLADSKPDFLSAPTMELIGKNGESWHFTEQGDFIAIEKEGFRIVYLRNQYGKVTQIAGLLGKTLMATIDLKYDDSTRLISAIGSNNIDANMEVKYRYDSAGRLAGIVSQEGMLGYEYEGFRVVKETWLNSAALAANDPKKKSILRRFEYNDNGQLTAEYAENKKTAGYSIASGKNLTTYTMKQPDDSLNTATISYDAAFKPIEARYGDGTKAVMTYPENGGNTIEITDANQVKTVISEAADGSQRTIETDNQPTIAEKYDRQGRVTGLTIGGISLFTQEWTPYGNLKSLKTGNCVLKPQYDENGLTESIHLIEPGSGDKHWESFDLDFAGRPVKISDHSGLDMALNYGKKGEIAQIITVRDGKNFGYSFTHNAKGQLESVQSSWGSEKYNYDAAGDLSALIIKKPGKDKETQMQMEFDAGKLKRATQFDGGATEISYNQDIALNELPESISCPNGLTLKYGYNEMKSLSNITIGNDRKVNLDYDRKGRVVGYSFSNK